MPPDRRYKVNPPIVKPYKIPKLKAVMASPSSDKQQPSQQPPTIRKVQVRSVIQEPDLRQEISKISKKRREKEKQSKEQKQQKKLAEKSTSKSFKRVVVSKRTVTVIPKTSFKAPVTPKATPAVESSHPNVEVPTTPKQTKKPVARKRCNRCKRYGHINSNCFFNPKNIGLIPPPTEEFLQSLSVDEHPNESFILEANTADEEPFIFDADTTDQDWLFLHPSISDITLN